MTTPTLIIDIAKSPGLFGTLNDRLWELLPDSERLTSRRRLMSCTSPDAVNEAVIGFISWHAARAGSTIGS